MGLIKISVYDQTYVDITLWWNNFLDDCWGMNVNLYDGDEYEYKSREDILTKRLEKYRAVYKKGYIEFDDHDGYAEFLLTWN